MALVASPAAAAQADLDRLQFAEVFRGLSNATSITHAGDGSGRLFVTEQVGRVLVYDGERLLAAPFLELRGRVRAGGERGLLSMAFHPAYASNGYFFVNYSDLGGATVIARFRVTADANLADPGSETIFLRVAQPLRNHNGGQIHFGPDGYLYIGMGDGGGAGDPGNLAQDLSSMHGKLLRIDVDRGSAAVAPESNPFVATSGARPEIWAYGLRNPWRFSFDRLTGDIFIADVGQNAAEEISFQASGSKGGENYGWRLMEGSRCYNPAADCDPEGTLVLPILEYPHAGGNCGGSVTGGYRYRGTRHPELIGTYFFADYCTGDFYAAHEENGAWTLAGPRETAISFRTFGEDEGGEIYFADSSVVYRIEAPPLPPRLAAGGIVNAATLQLGPGLAPGSLAMAFGTGLSVTIAAAAVQPLPGELGGGSMAFNDSIAVPQIFASPGQRNFLVPWELAGLAEAALTAMVGGQASPPVVVPLARVSPGIFVLNHLQQAAAQIASGGGVIAGPLGVFPGARPALPGETLEIFATGLGPVTNPPATGAAALADPASVTVEPVVVRLGGKSLAASFSGLVPAFAGLYQVTLRLSEGVPTGRAVPLVLQVAGVDSNTAFIAIAEPPAKPAVDIAP